MLKKLEPDNINYEITLSDGNYYFASFDAKEKKRKSAVYLFIKQLSALFMLIALIIFTRRMAVRYVKKRTKKT